MPVAGGSYASSYMVTGAASRNFVGVMRSDTIFGGEFCDGHRFPKRTQFQSLGIRQLLGATLSKCGITRIFNIRSQIHVFRILANFQVTMMEYAHVFWNWAFANSVNDSVNKHHNSLSIDRDQLSSISLMVYTPGPGVARSQMGTMRLNWAILVDSLEHLFPTGYTNVLRIYGRGRNIFHNGSFAVQSMCDYFSEPPSFSHNPCGIAT